MGLGWAIGLTATGQGESAAEAQASRCLASKHSGVASGPSRVRLQGAGKATASIPIGRRGARLLPPHQFLPGEEQQLSLWRDTRHGTGEALGRSARSPLEVAVAPRPAGTMHHNFGMCYGGRGLECENQRGKGPAKRASLTEPARGQAGQPQAGEGGEV